MSANETSLRIQTFIFAIGFVCTLILLSEQGRADDIEKEKEALRDAFSQLDKNQDGFLSAQEYLAGAEKQAKRKRDFYLFDLNGDGRLTIEEFSLTPGTISPWLRGPVPDPFDMIYEAAVEALDQTIDFEAKTNSSQLIPQNFVHNYQQSLIPSSTRIPLNSAMVKLAAQVDLDRDNKISRKEALRFLEIQMGRRLSNGQLLREPSGRVLKVPLWLWLDEDFNGKISKQEYLNRRTYPGAEEEFLQGDINGDGIISLAEFAAPSWLGYADPIMEFRKGDVNLDGYLSIEELPAITMISRQPLIAKGFAAFDLDGDGKWSLEEYRLSTIGNYIATWETALLDRDRDRLLSYEEFVIPRSDCRLIWRFYFHQFDKDGDLFLSSQEYDYYVIPPQSFHRMRLNGEQHELIYSSDVIGKCGSPAVSPDSKFILFDAFPINGIRQSRIFLMTIDGKDAKDLCDGTMPNWSADGTQFTTSRNSGLWIMNRDGSEATKIDDGWAAQWSPDGKEIAYTKGPTLWIYEVATGDKREVLGRGDHPYRYLYYNMAWAPDCSRLLLKAYEESPSDSDLISVDVRGDKPDLKVHLEGDNNFDADIAWTPDGKHVLISRIDPKTNKRLLHRLNIATGEAPVLMPGIDPELTYGGVVVSPDQQWIIMCTQRPNVLIE